MSWIFIIFFFSVAFNQENNVSFQEKTDFQKNIDLINNCYEKKKEFIIILKNGEKYKVTEVVEIDEQKRTCKFNILNNKLSGSIFHKKNISKVSNYKDSGKNPSMIREFDLEDIVLVELINYDKQIKEIKIYSFIVVGMYLVFSAF